MRWTHINACVVYLEVCLTCCKSYRLPFVVITIYGVVCVQLAHFSLGDWKDISIAHVIIIIKSEVSILPIVIIFSVVVCLRCLLHHILSLINCICIPGQPGFCFHCYCAVYNECKQSDTFWLADRISLFVHYNISLSSLCKIIWRHWTYKMPVRYILSSVWVRLSIFSQLSMICGAVCFQFTHFSCDDWKNK